MEPPIKKCAGFNALNSLGSVESGTNGVELRQASICASKIIHCSNVKVFFDKTDFKCPFTDFTLASHNSPVWGVRYSVSF